MAKIKKKTEKEKDGVNVVVPLPNYKICEFLIEGNAPLVMNKFIEEAKDQMKKQQEAGSTAKKGRKREPKDFRKQYEQTIHYSKQGWVGIPATALRSALVSACKVVGFQMTRAKISLFVLADGFDRDEGQPLIKITKGKPRYVEHYVKLANGMPDIKARAMFDEGWQAKVRIRYDGDQFTYTDVTHLLMRAGLDVGILAGRPDSRTSVGQGWGTFEIVNK
jgi:hypothetical protein